MDEFYHSFITLFFKENKDKLTGGNPPPPPIILAPPFQVNTLLIPPLWSCIICLNFFLRNSVLCCTTPRTNLIKDNFIWGKMYNQSSSRSYLTWALTIVNQKQSILVPGNSKLCCPLLKLSLDCSNKLNNSKEKMTSRKLVFLSEQSLSW